MIGKYASLEEFLRKLPLSEEEVTLTFEQINELLNEPRRVVLANKIVRNLQ